MSNETEETSECGGDSESSVVEQVKKAAVNPVTILLLAALFGGGTGTATSLIGNHTEPSGPMVLRLELSDDQIKALSPQRIDDKNLATKIETALLDQQIKTLREQVSELREERRPGRRQPPD